MKHKLVYRNYEFTDEDILNSPSVFQSNSMVSETLEADESYFTVKSNALGFMPLITVDDEYYNTINQEVFGFNDGDLRDYIYGSPVYYYENEVLKFKFYLKRIERKSSNTFLFECVSIVGLLSSITHEGKVYKGETCGSIIAEIMGDLPYTIEDNLAMIPIYNWLPIDTARNNLQQLLFVLGGSIIKTDSGDVHFCFNQPTEAKEIIDTDIYVGGSNVLLTPATKITVTEHAWYESAAVEEEVLYDNTAGVTAENYKIVFDAPHHSYRAEGLTLIDEKDNSIVVSGTGILYGKPYVHSTRTISKETGVNGEQKEIKVADAYLINSLNSNNVIERLASYYGQANEVHMAFVHNKEKTGDIILFTDPFGEEAQGYIREMSIRISNISKADAVVSTNWRPNHLGNGFNHFLIITSADLIDGAWNVPEELQGKAAQLVLFGGAQGGQGGFAGGTIGLTTGQWKFGGRSNIGFPGGRTDGASGGAGGKGGKPGKIIQANVTLGTSYNVSFGEGGEGGAGGTATRDRYYNDGRTDPAEGLPGTHSVFGPYDTDNGVDFAGNYVNMISGDVYAREEGKNGIAGGKGGKGGDGAMETYATWQGSLSDIDYPPFYAGDGENVGEWLGAQGSKTTGAYTAERHGEKIGDILRYDGLHGGGGGGGGAMGGLNATPGTMYNAWGGWYYESDPSKETHYTLGSWRTYDIGFENVYMSMGGNGADAMISPEQAILGTGGTGGNGGGGGGGAGMTFGYAVGSNGSSHGGGSFGGKGGNGSKGGKGSDGFALIYYGDE